MLVHQRVVFPMFSALSPFHLVSAQSGRTTSLGQHWPMGRVPGFSSLDGKWWKYPALLRLVLGWALGPLKESGLSEGKPIHPRTKWGHYMGVSENIVPLNPMVLLIIIPFLNGYFIGNIPNIFRQTHIKDIKGKAIQSQSTNKPWPWPHVHLGWRKRIHDPTGETQTEMNARAMRPKQELPQSIPQYIYIY